MFILWSAWACQKSGHRRCGGTKCLRVQCGSEVTLVQLGSLLPWVWMTKVAPKRMYLPTYLPTYQNVWYHNAEDEAESSPSCSYCVMYRLLLNRRERLSSTLTCACSCCASLALSIVVHTVHATRLNSQACLFQWPSFATILIAVPHLMIAVQVIQGITTEHSWYTRCLNVKLLWNNCPSRSVDCIIFNCPSFRHCRLCFVRVSSSWYEVKLCWRKRSRRKRT